MEEEGKQTKKSKTLLDTIQPPENYRDYQYPKVTIVIPVYNCAQTIGLTIESLLSQHYPDFEVVVVDAGSVDRTLEIIKGFRDDRIAIYSVSNYQPYEMLNKGINQAKGEYLNFLYPGDYYLSRDVLATIMTKALDEDKPDLVYCGTLLRYGRKDPQILYRSLDSCYLKRGQQPTSLQSCWFHNAVFQRLGKFDTSLSLRGGYDLFCRLYLEGDKRWVSITRVLTDYDLRMLTRSSVVVHFQETFRLVWKYFGVCTLIRWFWMQKDVYRYFKLWFIGLNVALFGQKKQ